MWFDAIVASVVRRGFPMPATHIAHALLPRSHDRGHVCTSQGKVNPWPPSWDGGSSAFHRLSACICTAFA